MNPLWPWLLGAALYVTGLYSRPTPRLSLALLGAVVAVAGAVVFA